MNSIKPTVGRVVWYWPASAELREKKGQPFCATITHVWGDTCVNLHVHEDGSFALDRYCPTSVTLGDPTEIPNGECWQWMPYQVGQASGSGAVKEAIKAIAACEHADVQEKVKELLGE